MDLNDVRTIVQAIADRDRPQPLLLPGSVSSVGASGLVDVTMDSDPEGSSVQARSLFADVAEGDRVMVLFDPPRGVFVVGTVARRWEAGQLVAYRQDAVTGEAYSTQTTVAAYSSPLVEWQPGRYYDLRLSVDVDLDANDADPVTVTGTMEVPFAPILNSGIAQFVATWGTVNGALLGGSVGTLHFSRLMLLSAAFSQSVDVDVTVRTSGIGGDVDLAWELAVFDAGPASAVLT